MSHDCVADSGVQNIEVNVFLKFAAGWQVQLHFSGGIQIASGFSFAFGLY